MKGVALADLHLGFRRHPAKDGGRNLREVDVERAWQECVRRITSEIKPDLVTIAGDIFHHPRVSMYAVKAFRDGVAAMAKVCPVVVLEGNHDAGKTEETLTPIVVPDDIDGVHIVRRPERVGLILRNGDHASLACFPYVDLGEDHNYSLEPDPQADVNILVMHAAVKGHSEGDTLPYFYGGDGKALDVGKQAERWDVIACGDYHEFTRLHPSRLAFYSGSIERTSSNVWQEEAPKGFVSYDTDAGTMEFVEIPTRPTFDYRVSEEGVDAGVVNMEMQKIRDDREHEGALVRLKVDDFPREDRAHIDWSLVRKLKASCAHFYLDVGYAQRALDDLGDRREREGTGTLATEARRFFEEDDPTVRRLALRFLGVEAEAEEAHQ